ncbi:hypothetical protein MJ575_10975 [Klebsiella pneumoniae]|nr:hypothetical protein MJ575_10975 [Klebsiella pneumoniae]
MEAVSVNVILSRWAYEWHPEWNSSEYALSRMLLMVLSPPVRAIMLKSGGAATVKEMQI